MANKSKPKFPGKLNVNQIDNTYVKPSIVKELQNKSVASKTTMPIANRFSDKVNTNKVDNTYVAPSVTKDLIVKTKTSNSTVPVSNWPANKNKNAVAEAVAKRKPVKKEKVKEEEEDNDSWLENVGEFVDPTGVSSYDDVYRSYKNTGLSGQTALEAFGALPLIGKIGKSGKVIAGGIGLLQDVVKGAKYLPSKMQQKVVDKAYDVYQGYAKTGGKELDKALGWSTEKLIDNIPYLNPSKWKSSTKAINSVNAAFKAGRVSDAVQAALGSKDDSGFTYNPNDDNTLKYNGRNIFPNSGASENMYAKGGTTDKPRFPGKLETNVNTNPIVNNQMPDKVGVMVNGKPYVKPPTSKDAIREDKKTTLSKVGDFLENPLPSSTGNNSDNMFNMIAGLPGQTLKAIYNTAKNASKPVATAKKLGNAAYGIAGELVGDAQTTPIEPGLKVAMDAAFAIPTVMGAKKAIKAVKSIANNKTSVNELINQTASKARSEAARAAKKSEIDWSKWNKEIPENTSLIKEYNAIEQTSKANGNWMKNPDGSAFQGTPEQFVQQNSSNFKSAFPEGATKTYRGAHKHIDDFANRDNSIATFLTDNKANAETYATSDGSYKKYYHPDIDPSNEWIDGVYQLGLPKNLPKVVGEAEGRNWRLLNYDNKIAKGIKNEEWVKNFQKELKNNQDLYKYNDYNPDKKYLSTDIYANYVKNPANSENIAQINNVIDQMGHSTNIPANTVYAVDANKVPLKSLMYNNGMFDMTNPNIYKAVAPITVGALGAGAASQQKRNGGTILNEGQKIAYNNWLKNNNITESEDYDMKGYWKEKGFLEPKHVGHFDDTYKVADWKPFTKGNGDNYPAISEGSKYSGNPNYINSYSNNPSSNSSFDKRGQGFWDSKDNFVTYAGGGRVLPKFGNNRIVKYPTGGDVFSNPELANALPDNSPVRIGNEDLYKNYKPQASEYIYEKEIPVVAPVSKMPAVVSKTVAPSKVIKKAIKKEEATIENMSPVKKAMITNPAKAQTFQPLAADAQAVYEEKKKNPAWKNFKGNYSIYSKENSMLHLFDNKHNLIDQTRAGRGVGKGDAPNLANPKDWYDSNKPKKGQEQAIKNSTTPSGAYAIKENPMNYNDYGTKTYKFGKPNQYNAQTAMHGIYKGDTYNRTKIINDPSIKQAYVSNGCLNIPAPFLNKNDNQINSGDSLFITKEPKFATGGKVLPRFGDAGTVDTGAGITDYAGYAQMAMPIAHMLMPDEQVKDTRGNVVGNKIDTGYAVGSKALEWGAKGAQFGGPAGAIVGATIGAGLGYFDNKKNNTKIAKQKLLNDDSYYNEDTSKAFNTNTGNFTTRPSTNTNIRFAAGGQVVDEDMGNPNAELELNETFRDPMTGEAGMVDGPSHDNGGIEMSLAEGTQIWSDRLKHNGRTFASLTKPIINKIANIEKGLDTNPNSRFKQNSIKLLNAQLDFFFDIQESNKQQDEMKRTLKKQEGGVVDDMGNYHYANGGIYIKPENRNKMAMGGMMKYDEGGTKNQYLLPDGSYNKRQFMLDQLNPNKNQYKAFDPAMSIYKANQNADLAKEKNSLGAEMDQMNIASRGNTPITMGPMNRPEGYIDYTNVNIPETIQGRQLPAFADASRPPVNNAPVYSGANDPFRKISNQYDPNIVNASKVNTTPAYQPYNSGATKPGGMINFNRELPKPVLPQVYNSTPYIKARGNQNPYKGTDIAGTKTVDNNGNITDSNLTNNTPISKMDEFRNRIESYRNRGKIGQGVTAAISNQTQADRLKGLARPDKINNVNYLSSLTGPDLVNYGNQRNAIEQGASAVTDKAGRYLGNSGSIMATANAANLQKQQQLAESYQGQENTNAGIMNQALAQKNQLSVAQAERNSAIEQENKANKYAYDAMLASGLNANDAITASQMGKMFGNDVSFGNDLERSRILGNKYAGKVWNSTDDNTIAANNSQLGYGRFGGVVGKLNKPMIKKGMPGKRSLKNK